MVVSIPSLKGTKRKIIKQRIDCIDPYYLLYLVRWKKDDGTIVRIMI